MNEPRFDGARRLDYSVSSLAVTAHALAWHTTLLARWIIDAEFPETKIALAFDLYRVATWASLVIARSGELGFDINENAMRRSTLAADANARLIAAIKDGSNEALVQVSSSPLREALEAASSLPSILDEPTIELLDDISGSLDRRPLHIPSDSEGTLWPKAALSPAAPEMLAGVKPGRSDSIFTGAKSAQPFEESLTLQDSTIRLLHQNLTELELPTMESCCRLILHFPEMPWAFTAETARQCWDEARHAHSFMKRLEELGGVVGEFSYTHSLWEMTADQPLAVRLAIHQRIGEWIGVDGALWNADRLRALGDTATADLLDFIARDEITHVALGNRWIRWVCSSDEQVDAVNAIAANRRRAFGKRVDGRPLFPFNRWACERAGFTAAEVQALEDRFVAEGSVL